MTTELKLYKKYEAGLRYLLAQSPDSRGLVPDTEESAWERIGTKNHVEARVCLHLPPCFYLRSSRRAVWRPRCLACS